VKLKPLCKCGIVGLSVAIALALVACSDSGTKVAASSQPGVEEAVSIATDAYVYGYPLVTMDMTRKQFTNVAVPDASHAPVGQRLKLRTYPAVDNHTVTAPNADTLYTTAWLDVSREPASLTWATAITCYRCSMDGQMSSRFPANALPEINRRSMPSPGRGGLERFRMA
jgi:hypothetical protein